MQTQNMVNHSEKNFDDEINFREVFTSLWHGKVYIFFFIMFFILPAVMYLQVAEKKYLVEYKLKPVGEDLQKNSLSGLGGIASLAGIQLPSSSSDDFKIFKELMSSVEVSEIIIKNKKLIKRIYHEEWNSSLNIFSESKSIPMIYIKSLKRIIFNEIDYIPPNARRLAIYISKKISINEDKKTGFLTLKAKTSKPEMLSSLIYEIIETSDEIMRQRYINFSKEPLAFYKDKLRTARSREHREALAELIGNEEQKLMFAAKGKYFVAEPYIEPTISLHPVAPKPIMILLLSLILGTFTGCGIVLLRSGLARDQK